MMQSLRCVTNICIPNKYEYIHINGQLIILLKKEQK